jgi:hypothetical protein
MIDPKRIQETIDVVNSSFKLKSLVGAGEIYVPGFVPN